MKDQEHHESRSRSSKSRSRSPKRSLRRTVSGTEEEPMSSRSSPRSLTSSKSSRTITTEPKPKKPRKKISRVQSANSASPSPKHRRWKSREGAAALDLQRACSFRAFSGRILGTSTKKLGGIGSEDILKNDIQVDLLEDDELLLDSSDKQQTDSLVRDSGHHSFSSFNASNCTGSGSKHRKSHTCKPTCSKPPSTRRSVSPVPRTRASSKASNSDGSLRSRASSRASSNSDGSLPPFVASPIERPTQKVPSRNFSGGSAHSALKMPPRQLSASSVHKGRFPRRQFSTGSAHTSNSSSLLGARQQSSSLHRRHSDADLDSSAESFAADDVLHYSSNNVVMMSSRAPHQRRSLEDNDSGADLSVEGSNSSLSNDKRPSRLKHFDLDVLDAQGDISPLHEKNPYERDGALSPLVVGLPKDITDDAFLNDVPGMELHSSRSSLCTSKSARPKPESLKDDSQTNRRDDPLADSLDDRLRQSLNHKSKKRGSEDDSFAPLRSAQAYRDLINKSYEESDDGAEMEDVVTNLKERPIVTARFFQRASQSVEAKAERRRVSFDSLMADEEDNNLSPLKKPSAQYSMGWSTTSAAYKDSLTKTASDTSLSTADLPQQQPHPTRYSTKAQRRSSSNFQQYADWNQVDQSVNLMDTSAEYFCDLDVSSDNNTGGFFQRMRRRFSNDSNHSGNSHPRHHRTAHSYSSQEETCCDRLWAFLCGCGACCCECRKPTCSQLGLFALVLLFIGLACGVHFMAPLVGPGNSSSSDNAEDAPTAAPTPSLETVLQNATAGTEPGEISRQEEFRVVLEDYLQLTNQFENATSPASYALQWLTNTDAAQLEVKDKRVPARFALATLYYATHPVLAPFHSKGQPGPNMGNEIWKKDDKWMTDAMVCAWHGVECENSIVTHLNLTANNLQGHLPEELKALSQLVVLDLSKNRHLHGSLTGNLVAGLSELEFLIVHENDDLTGSLPTQLGQLTKLQELSLWGNALSGPIVSELNQLTSLRMLRLGDNYLTGTVPDLSALSDLTYLELDSNSLTSTIPPWIGGLENLHKLQLSENDFIGTIPPELAHNTKLGLLYLAENKLEGPIPEIFVDMRDLTDLQLHQNRFRSSLPTSIRHLASLKRLTIDNNGMTGTLPADWDVLTDLEALAAHHNSLIGPIPGSYGNLESLRDLWVNHNFLQETVPSQLGKLSDLTHLFLESNAFKGALPEELGRLEQLQSFRIFETMVTGTVPASVCALQERELKEMTADCKEIQCDCCTKCW